MTVSAQNKKIVEMDRKINMIRDCANNNSWQGEKLGGMSENDYSLFDYNVKDNDIKRVRTWRCKSKKLLFVCDLSC